MDSNLVTVSNLVESLQHPFLQINKEVLVLQIREIIETEDAKRKSDEQASKFGRQIMELSYHLEDLVESNALGIASRRNGFVKRIFRGSSHQMFIQHLQTEFNHIIRELNEYSSKISQKHHAIEVEPREREISEPREGEISADQAGRKEHEQEENVVGKEDQMIVADVLTKGSAQLSFISICGMGGTGKTKLAKRVFKSQHILDYFQVRAWVRVSQVYQRRDLLAGLANFASPAPATNMMQFMLLSDEDLAKLIYQTLKETRYLIVLDDVWSPDAWLSIRTAFPSNDNGSRILLTTRTRDVALAVGGPNTHIFNMKVNEMRSMDEKILLDALTGGRKQLSFISICGMTGTGKTKLARQVISSPQISNHFEVAAWLWVSQVYQRRGLLLSILVDICGSNTDMMHLIMQLSDEDLAKLTYQTLKEKRYLILLDDIWSADAWLSICMAFPSDDNGSRILLTTQTEDVAKAVGGPSTIILNLKVNEMRLKDEKRLLDHLTSGSKRLSFVSICGMEGTGKTKLAKRVFNSPSIVYHFHVCAWISVSEVYSRRELLLGILFNILDPTTYLMSLSVSDEELAELTYKTLKRQTYLIVLDDIWSVDTWLSIRIAFPSDNNGSRILLTTRTTVVASAVGGPIIYMTSTLADEESWESLRLKAGLDERELEPEVERILKKIVMRSGGESLIGIMLNNMLKAMTADECKVMLQDIVNRSEGQEIVVDVLKLSYYALPLHLRPCLLYLGHFPKDSEIETDTLYQLWTAEGLVSTANRNDGESMMVVAARYLDELAKGSWVEMLEEENFSQGRFKSCYLHDAVRDLCISKVKDDELMDSLEENSIMSSAFRRAISLDKYERTNIHLHRNADYLRSLLLFSSCQSEQGFIRPREVSNLDRLTWLRVLRLCSVDFKDGKFPKGVEKLIYLRYLSFRECYLVELSASISKMLYLQTLDLRVRNECEMTIPNVLDNLEQLRYLYLPLAYRCPHDEKLKLDKLIGLEIVENFDTSVCDAEDISKLTNLLDLSVSVEGNDIELLLKCLDKCRSHLPRISLDIRNFDCYTEQRISVMKRLFEFGDIQSLGIEGHLGNIQEFNEISSSKLTKIVLNGSEFEDDPMQILQELNHLKVLVLETEAYVGKKNPDTKMEKTPKKMKCSSSRFPELRFLKLSKLYKLKEWEVENNAMKNLGTLAIQNCRKLKMLPEGLKFISGLRKLEISSMPPEFVGRIRTSDVTEGADFYKIRHVLPNVKIDGQHLILKERQQVLCSARPGEDPQSSSIFQVAQRVERETSFESD